MGVMSCYRPNCENIMCHVYVDGVGYVCHECETEFQVYLEKHGIKPEAEGEFKFALKMFMTTDKDDFMIGAEMDLNEFFNKYRQ